MRQITEKSVNAFLNRTPFKSANMEVEKQPSVKTEGKRVYFLKLHGNIIAQIDEHNSLFITSAGWRTNTTKERLNGLPNVSIYQKKGIWYLNGEMWDGNWIKVN